RKQPAMPVQLQFIQADYLLKNLPPSVSKDDILATGDSTLVFFTGSDEKKRQFLRELASLDKPIPQIRYELLVVQYQDSAGLNWELSLGNSATTGSESTAFLGSIGKLLQLNFDIVSAFGYLFAVDLNLQITKNKASVLADTTLNGLSGQDVKFQNTETTRYRELETDPDTGKLTATGLTREITTGLIISTNGWVSGDGMITMNVSSTVSKQGASTSDTTGTLPSTSEKVVSTHVRTRSGKPVVIGGLLQQQKDSTIEKVPFLGDIPLLGWLFQKRVDSDTNTELVIYIVPHVEYPESRVHEDGRRMEDLYASFVKGGAGG
ncbi:MAG TPA: type II and III secretion system protein, partial [Spirochaetia bacterium]